MGIPVTPGWATPLKAPLARHDCHERLARLAIVVLVPLVASVVGGCVDGAVRTEAERLEALERMIEETRQEFPDAPSLGLAEVGALHDDGRIVFIDARTPEERTVSVLPGAITVEEFLADPGRYSDRTAVAYCTVGYRSAQVTEQLNADGHEVYNFEGSILAWTHAGRVLESETGPTRRVHVYGERWNLVADGYEAVW